MRFSPRAQRTNWRGSAPSSHIRLSQCRSSKTELSACLDCRRDRAARGREGSERAATPSSQPSREPAPRAPAGRKVSPAPRRLNSSTGRALRGELAHVPFHRTGICRLDCLLRSEAMGPSPAAFRAPPQSLVRSWSEVPVRSTKPPGTFVVEVDAAEAHRAHDGRWPCAPRAASGWRHSHPRDHSSATVVA